MYRFGGPVRDDLDEHDPTFARLAQNFFTTFPQLEGVRFSHRWGGAIDTCSRFSVFFGTAHRGRVAYAVGYTGLGVGGHAVRRPGGAGPARRAAHRGDGEPLRARASRCRSRPSRCAARSSQLTRNRLAAADRRDGRRGLWLGLLDRLGLGFDS